jgi:choline dehydrogenase-like flavoprotein
LKETNVMAQLWDYLVVGSGAGGSAAASRLAKSGASVLLVEKGLPLPTDGSTLDADTVVTRGAFLAREPWLDRTGQVVFPEEHFNLGGKTKWYGAALLRFDPHELEADPAHGCLAWPLGYAELAPWYEEAERLLGVQRFAVEPGLRRIVDGLRRQDGGWREAALQVGLAPDILAHPLEARHFDGFASAAGLKSDAETLLGPVRRHANLRVLTGAAVRALLPSPDAPERVVGVECEDGQRHEARRVILAAGALHSPRLLQTYFRQTGLDERLPAARNVGRNYKFHVLTAMIAFSPRRVTDVLCKTALLLHDALPHSSVQTLGGNLAAEIVRAQAPGFVPRRLVDIVAGRGYGLFLQTEDGSHPDNRVIAGEGDAPPRLDYDPARVPEAVVEHTRLVATLRRQLRRLGYMAVAQPIPVTGTAHCCGTLVTGADPATSVVDPQGRVHGMQNLYVADGSVLPRMSRVNPALTIYAWGLRLAAALADQGRRHERTAAAADPVRA